MDAQHEAFIATGRLLAIFDTQEGWQSVTFRNQKEDTPAAVLVGVDAAALEGAQARKQAVMEQAGIASLVSDITFVSELA